MAKTFRSQFSWVIEVAAVENHGRSHGLPKESEIRSTKITPFGHHSQGIGGGRRIEGIGGILNPITVAGPDMIHRLRIEDPNHR